jgi:hypothetical protein
MTKPARFTQADVARAIKTVESVGKCVRTVDFPPQGGFRLLLVGDKDDADARGSGQNEWDEVLAT